jgi:hypothetical protein
LKHPTSPFKSYFFIAETDARRLLKIAFIWLTPLKETSLRTTPPHKELRRNKPKIYQSERSRRGRQ